MDSECQYVKRSKYSLPIAIVMMVFDLVELFYYWAKQKKMTHPAHLEYRDGLHTAFLERYASCNVGFWLVWFCYSRRDLAMYIQTVPWTSSTSTTTMT